MPDAETFLKLVPEETPAVLIRVARLTGSKRSDDLEQDAKFVGRSAADGAVESRVASVG